MSGREGMFLTRLKPKNGQRARVKLCPYKETNALLNKRKQCEKESIIVYKIKNMIAQI